MSEIKQNIQAYLLKMGIVHSFYKILNHHLLLGKFWRYSEE